MYTIKYLKKRKSAEGVGNINKILYAHKWEIKFNIITAVNM